MPKGKGYLSTHVCFPNLNCFMDAWFDSQMPIHSFHPHLRGFQYIYILYNYNMYNIYITTTCLRVHLNFKPLTCQYGLPKDFPNGCCRYAMSQKNNMSTVDNQSIPILKMCEWVQLATSKHPDLVVLCIKSTSDTSRSSKNRTSQKSENSISIYHPQKQLNRVSVPHVPRSKEKISHQRPLHLFVTYFWLLNDKCACFFVEFGPISLQYRCNMFQQCGAEPRSWASNSASFFGYLRGSCCNPIWLHVYPFESYIYIYISTIFGSFWRVNVGLNMLYGYTLIKLAVHWGKSIHWCLEVLPDFFVVKIPLVFVVSSHPHRCWLNIPI